MSQLLLLITYYLLPITYLYEKHPSNNMGKY